MAIKWFSRSKNRTFGKFSILKMLEPIDTEDKFMRLRLFHSAQQSQFRPTHNEELHRLIRAESISLSKVAATLLSAALLTSSQGLAADGDLCTALLNQGIRDVQNVSISEARFNEIKARVCNSQYSNYSTARSNSADGGLDVFGIFGINGSDASASSQYDTKWSNFCASDYQKAISDTQIRSYTSTINLGLLSTFDHCVDSERFIRYVQPNPSGRTFQIVFKNRRDGVVGFTIDQLTILDVTTNMRLDPTKDCDLPSNLPYSTGKYNSLTVLCSKPAADEIEVNGRTDAGLIDPVTVPAVPSAPPTIADRVSAIEGKVSQLAKRYYWLAYATAAQPFAKMLPEEGGKDGDLIKFSRLDSTVDPTMRAAFALETGSGFTAPVSGLYQIDSHIEVGTDYQYDPNSSAVSGFYSVRLHRRDPSAKDQEYALASDFRAADAVSWNPLLSGSTVIYLVSGEKIDFRLVLRLPRSIKLHNGERSSYVAIALLRETE